MEQLDERLVVNKIKDEWTLHGKFLFFHLSLTSAKVDQGQLAHRFFNRSGPSLSRWLRGQQELSDENLRSASTKVSDLSSSSISISSFESAFKFLEAASRLGRMPDEPMPEMARAFLEILGLPHETGSFLLESNLSKKLVQIDEREKATLDEKVRGIHRAELIVFAPDIQRFLTILGELRDLVHMLQLDPTQIAAASMLQDSVDDFKGFGVGSSDELFVQMQRYFGWYMINVTMLLDSLQMLGNERVYGFCKENSYSFGKGQIAFEGEPEFQEYLRKELLVGQKLLDDVISFVRQSFRERPDLMLMQEAGKTHATDLVDWAHKIGRDTRGNELLFEPI